MTHGTSYRWDTKGQHSAFPATEIEMHTGYDREEEDEGCHWLVDLVVGVVFVGIVAAIVPIPSCAGVGQ